MRASLFFDVATGHLSQTSHNASDEEELPKSSLLRNIFMLKKTCLKAT